MPLECPAERWVTDHWLYFYECSVGCIGILKDWLLRAVSAALDDGMSRLSLDCVQDYALHVDIYRQMALDAYEGEQRLNHTASNREHVWRLLQGGELIAPVPPLPPRETPDPQPETGTVNMMQPGEKTEDEPSAPKLHDEAVPPPPVKKTRTRKKAEAAPKDSTELGGVAQAEEGVTPPTTSPKRSRKKKVTDEAVSRIETEVRISSDSSALQVSTEADAVSVPGKPKRTRRVGEPKPKRYPVGEKDPGQGV